MNTTAEEYVNGLRKAYRENGAEESWSHFEKVKHGAAEEDIEKIKAVYPGVPDALVSLLQYADGTYFREYGGEKILLYFLGSDVEEYPYYLLSCGQIVKTGDEAGNYYSGYIKREYEGVEVDEKITDRPENLNWLHFSDCMNNGGTSQLFIDFSPSAKGKAGQVVRFLHDPDEFRVIAESFEDYLKNLMNSGYDFICEDILD